jgi:hypothetical protein
VNLPFHVIAIRVARAWAIAYNAARTNPVKVTKSKNEGQFTYHAG